MRIVIENENIGCSWVQNCNIYFIRTERNKCNNIFCWNRKVKLLYDFHLVVFHLLTRMN